MSHDYSEIVAHRTLSHIYTRISDQNLGKEILVQNTAEVQILSFVFSFLKHSVTWTRLACPLALGPWELSEQSGKGLVE